MTVPHRKGFSLLITLSVLSVVIGLTTILLGYYSKVQEDAAMTKALIQANVYYADITSQLKKLKGKQLARLYRSALPLQSKDKRFQLNLSCAPLAKGININWLKYDNDRAKQKLFVEAQGAFDLIAQKYALENGDRLLEMLVREIKGGSKFVKKAQSRLSQKNGIISYKQFRDIIKRYEVEEDDRHVGKVPWRSYFSFSPTAEKISIAYSSPELISYLFDIDLAVVREWFALPIEEKTPLKQFVEENGGDYAEKKDLLSDYQGESICTARFALEGNHYRFSFEYIQGEAKYFEFFGKH